MTAGHSKYGCLARTAAVLARARLTPGPRLRLYQVEKAARKDPDSYRADLTHLVELLAEGRFRPVVTRMPLTRAARRISAWKRVRSWASSCSSPTATHDRAGARKPVRHHRQLIRRRPGITPPTPGRPVKAQQSARN